MMSDRFVHTQIVSLPMPGRKLRDLMDFSKDECLRGFMKHVDEGQNYVIRVDQQIERTNPPGFYSNAFEIVTTIFVKPVQEKPFLMERP